MNHANIFTAIFLAINLSTQCSSIRVPVIWNNGDNSEVQTKTNEQIKTAVETFDPQQHQNQPIPLHYFQYTAPKPKFAIDVASFHGVPFPEQHYKSYPVRPYTGKNKPELGNHQILDQSKPVFKEFQQYVKDDKSPKEHVTTISSNYDVFHPYKEEEPGLEEIYKDPILDKIRNDIVSSKNRLQNYETDVGKPDISADEYLESLQETDHKKGPKSNMPATYENHRPLRRPIYYRMPPKLPYRDQNLNHKYRNPWNHHSKVRPVNYKPLKNHLHRLRQHHALTFDDEHNEYPQVLQTQNFAEPPDGYDIYEKGKEGYNRLRNNLDESINQARKENQPATYENLEMQGKEKEDYKNNEEEDFVPIRNYAQVRKTETYKHLPRKAAFEDADSYDEIKNAPRLKEAVKSTKAQTVYSEEGYEDAAYDHAGEQKHADDHEAHGGFLREKELSGGKYKAPSESQKYEDGQGSLSRDEIQDGKKWKDSKEDIDNNNHSEDYSEVVEEHSSEVEAQNDSGDDEQQEPRHKREQDQKSSEETAIDSIENPSEQHDVIKRETDFNVPEINLNTTYLSDNDISQIAKLKKKLRPKSKKSSLTSKYPYYFRNLENIHKNSPLRYAENLKLIPAKSKSETAFYDSRSKLQCPEVDEEIDPVPKTLKNGEKPDSEESEEIKKGDTEVSQKEPRLKGLGDKIDCFKAKYFGNNPLDSPFFKEEVISNPEPLSLPKSSVFELFTEKKLPQIMNLKQIRENYREGNDENIFNILNKLNPKTHSKNQSSNPLLSDFPSTQNREINADIVKNINNGSNLMLNNESLSQSTSVSPPNLTYLVFKNKEDIRKLPTILRRKRSIPFNYEPYKIVRVQNFDPQQKTNYRQLKQGESIDTVTKTNDNIEQPVKRNVANRSYKNIGRNERARLSSKADVPTPSISFINTDERRGEPRYEVTISNHKPKYEPIDNKKSMSLQDYRNRKKLITNVYSNENANQETISGSKYNSSVKSIGNEVPIESDEESSPTNTVKRVISTSTSSPNSKLVTTEPTSEQKHQDESSEEDYDEDEDEDEDEESSEESDESEEITTATVRPAFRKRNSVITTTLNPNKNDEDDNDNEKLKLTTRFRNPPTQESNNVNKKSSRNEKPVRKEIEKSQNTVKSSPKISEKKKKSSKTTLVTDSNRYGDDEDDMRKEEVDRLIGVKQVMDDYIPLYEKEMERMQSSEPTEENHEESEEQKEDAANDENEDEEDDDEEYESSEESDTEIDESSPVTTPEPDKRSVERTTESPVLTTETRNKMHAMPTIVKKKIEIHKELPNNKSAPHITQFKQDIKEVEIIKEIPAKIARQKTLVPVKNLEALELYKDEKLPTEVNNLGAVEVFKENLDLTKGPKHGGNYRSARIASTSELPVKKENYSKRAPSRKPKTINSENVNNNEDSNILRSRETPNFRNRQRNAKLVELADDNERTQLHGGNLKATKSNPIRKTNKNARLIELNDEVEDDSEPHDTHGRNFKSQDSAYPQSGFHGGNYRSARLRDLAKGGDKNKDARHSAAVVLNSFAQAAPILTTTPAYIIDPSKRMYYYVDT